jgi:hypothetical protein
MIEIGSSSGWLSQILGRNSDTFVTLQTIRKLTREKVAGPLKGIEKNTSKMVKLLGSAPKAQAGAVSFQTELFQTHGTPQHPEYIIPHEDLSRMVSGGGGGGARNNYFSINIHDQIDPFTAQRLMRDVMLPKMIAALETNDYKRDLQDQLGIE